MAKRTPAVYPYNTMEMKPAVLRAVIFDLDGVLLDSEPLHMSAFKKALGEKGKDMTEQDYAERYLSLDDRGAFRRFFEDSKMTLSAEELSRLIEEKSAHFGELVQSEGVLPFPAVPELVMALSQRYPLAVATGSLKKEAELLLEASGIRAHFEAIVSADDVAEGKPHPESYLKAVEALNNTGNRPMPIRPDECVVIEDSKFVIATVHQLGMKCIAVASSYPSFELSGADLVIPSISTLRVSQLEDLFNRPAPQAKPATVPTPNQN